MEHLGSHNYRLLHFHAFADQYTLDARDLFCRNFDTQVTAGDHDTVSHFQDFVDIVDPFLILDLGDDLDRAFMFVEDLLDIQYILFVSYKRVGDEIEVVLDSPKNVFTVFFCQ